MRGRWGIAIGLAMLALVACQGADSGPRPTAPLAIYIDGKLVRQESAEALARRPADYTRGGLRGWHVFGGILTPAESQQVAAVEAVSEGGRRLLLERPADRYPDRAAVVFVDRGGALRFTMAATDEPSGVPHGRGPGDGRGGGNRRGANAPLTVERVTELRLTTGALPAAPAPATAPGQALKPGAFRLALGGQSVTLEPDGLRSEFAGAERWPLREVVKRRTDRPVARVEVRGREGDHVTIDAAAWSGAERMDLRLNRRGLMKLESDLGTARDVVQVDVILQ